MENAWDRAARRLRPFFITGAIVSLPVFLFSYAQMWEAVYDQWSGWALVAAGVSHAVTIVGLAMLHDQQSEKRKQGRQR
jgi:hypothetical protein